MMKKLLLSLFLFSACNPIAAAAPRGGVKLDLVNSLMQLMTRCLDYKLENEMFKAALLEMQQILEEMGPMIKEKAALQQKIAQLLMVIAVITQESVSVDPSL